MKCNVLLVLLLASFYVADAQKIGDPAKYAKIITATGLKEYLSVIAGVEMEGRNTPSPGLEKAADYIESKFRSFGLRPGNNGNFRQTYTLSKDSVTKLALSINGKSYNPYADFNTSVSIPENIDLKFTDYVFVGYGIEDSTRKDYGSQDVKGRLVVFLNGSPRDYEPRQKGRLSPATLFNKIRTAKAKGAAAVIVIMDTLAERRAGATTYRPVSAGRPQNNTIPVFAVGNTIVQDMSGYDISTVKKAVDNNQTEVPSVMQANIRFEHELNKSSATASNVIGLIEGADKRDEYLFITAHYDHVGKDNQGNIYYGADDDGSGTVSIMKIAEAFAKAKKEGKGPRRNVVIMAVSGEEKGLWGSEHYSDHPIFPLDKTTADLNIDMIGRTGFDYLKDIDSINYVYVIGDDKLSTDLTPLTELVNHKYTNLKLDKKFNDPNDPERIYYRSDHYNFAKKGVPVIFYFDGIHADYHRPTDTVDKINFPLMAKRAQLVFYTAWEMANRNDMLRRDLKLPQ